ncbi:hypothetical protein, partial [Aeromonas caviae]|uniref:hypothetical protein n=1 Tax=Aeromonas caviae TaxID=648 RepID=UPI002B4A90E3
LLLAERTQQAIAEGLVGGPFVVFPYSFCSQPVWDEQKIEPSSDNPGWQQPCRLGLGHKS